MRDGTYHVLSPSIFGMDTVAGEASYDSKVLFGHIMMIVLSSCEGEYDIW